MIPRYQRILFFSLNAAILIMALVLLRGCEQTREKLTRHRDETPLAAPIASPSETIHLALANDVTGAITVVDRDLPLPLESTARARVLLGRLIAEYTFKNSTHPLASGPAIDDVFLLDLPLRPAGAPTGSSPYQPFGREPGSVADAAGGQLAVINLHGAFADSHPSGIEPEMLTIESIVGTVYANFARIQQVRFLVDGQPRETLNGHADLMRTYPVVDTAARTGQDNR